MEQKERDRLRDDLYQDYEEEKKVAVRNDDSESSGTDSDQEGDPSGLRRRNKKSRR